MSGFFFLVSVLGEKMYLKAQVPVRKLSSNLYKKYKKPSGTIVEFSPDLEL